MVSRGPTRSDVPPVQFGLRRVVSQGQYEHGPGLLRPLSSVADVVIGVVGRRVPERLDAGDSGQRCSQESGLFDDPGGSGLADRWPHVISFFHRSTDAQPARRGSAVAPHPRTNRDPLPLIIPGRGLYASPGPPCECSGAAMNPGGTLPPSLVPSCGTSRARIDSYAGQGILRVIQGHPGAFARADPRESRSPDRRYDRAEVSRSRCSWWKRSAWLRTLDRTFDM